MSSVDSRPTSGNRVSAAIARLRDRIPQRIADGLTTQEDIDQLHKSLDMDMMEYCKFQEHKSAAMGSRLTLEEAQTIYGYLGNTPEHFNRQPVEVKSVLTRIFAELLGGAV